MRACGHHRRVAIIGGGISGLAAAYRLRELAATVAFPLEVALFERGRDLGRALGTLREDGFVMETGADSFLSAKPWALDLAGRLGLDSEMIGTRTGLQRTHVVRAGRLMEIPEGFTLLAPTRFMPIAVSRLFSLRGKLRMAIEPLIPARRDGGDESLASFVTRRVGREVLERVAQPLAGGIYTANAASLSLQATMPRFLEMERRHGSLFRGLRAARNGQTSESSAATGVQWSPLISFRGGMRTLVDALAARLGETVRTECEVVALERGEGGRGWRVRLKDGSEFAADGLVLATPAAIAARLLQPHAPQIAGLLNEIGYASVTTVNLAYDERDCPHLPESFGFVVPTIERRKIIAATFSSRKFEHRAPHGKVLIRAFIGGAVHEEMMAMDDDAKVAAAREELRALVGLTAAPLLTRVRSWPDAMPQYKVGHLERVAEIERESRALPGLALAGAAYRGVGVPDCIHSGEQAAAAILSQLTPDAQRMPSQ
jgi:protoporphyrinogen/coproporphyrinogen III oxidase